MTELHYCSEHNTRFFKTTKMRAYAHPTEETDENGKVIWCNESDRVIKTPADLLPEPLTSDSRAESIEKQVSLKCASETLPEGTAMDILIRANLFFRWLRGDLEPPPDALERKETPVKAESSVVASILESEAPITAEQIKHLSGLVGLGKWMKEQGWKVNRLIELKQGQYNEILKAFEKNRP